MNIDLLIHRFYTEPYDQEIIIAGLTVTHVKLDAIIHFIHVLNNILYCKKHFILQSIFTEDDYSHWGGGEKKLF